MPKFAMQQRVQGQRSVFRKDIDSSNDEEVLLYGFEDVRKIVLPALKKANPESRFIKIDDLNHYIDITEGSVMQDFPGLINRIKKFVPLRGPYRMFYLETARGLSAETGLSLDRCFDLLESWRDFLKKNSAKFSLLSLYGSSKVNDATQAKERLYRLINKNFCGPLRDKKTEFSETKALASILNEEDPRSRDALLRENMERFPTVALSISNAFFRKTSKLGLEWASENNIHVLFIESALEQSALEANQPNNRQKNAAFVGIPSEITSATRTKNYAQSKRVAAYDPITFSEMRHYRRLNMKNVEALRVDDDDT